MQYGLDEIHRLWSQGYTDEQIIERLKIKRATFYFYKKKLVAQISQMWANKQMTDYTAEVQLCKERLNMDRIIAEQKAAETGNPLWGNIAAELAISILKLEAEGITAISNGRLRWLEEKAGYSRPDESATPILTIATESTAEQQSTNDESETEDQNRVA